MIKMIVLVGLAALLGTCLAVGYLPVLPWLPLFWLAMAALAYFLWQSGRSADLQRAVNGQAPTSSPKDGQETELLAGLPLPALMIDSKWQIAAANDLAKAWFRQDMQGQMLYAHFRNPELAAAVKAMLGAPGNQAEAQRIHDPASQHDLLLSPWRDPSAPASLPQILLVLLDRRHEMALEAMRIKFIANASHELRTPLASLIGLVETLRGAARDDPEGSEAMLVMMSEQSERMAQLVDDLLLLSRVESRERQHPTTVINLTEIAAESAAWFEAECQRKGTVFHAELGEQAFYLLGEVSEIKSLINNLLGNALKYSGGAPITMALALHETDPDKLTLTVRDQGPGVDADITGRLTERFFRAASEQSPDVPGTGLGLSLVKHIAARHQGELRIESALGEGFSVTAELPKAASPE